MSSEVRRFYKDRAKAIDTDWKRFDYDEEGNMVERTQNEEGQYVVVKTIALPTYRPLTYEERDTMERLRQEAIAEATTLFETARRALYDASRGSNEQNEKEQEKDLLALNRAVRDAEYELYRARFPLRSITRDSSVQIRKMDFSQTDKRLLPFDVWIASTFPFSLQNYYVREGESVAPLQSVAELQQQRVILFSTPDANEHGYLSLEWAVDLEFQGTMYHSAKQAVYAEMAKIAGDEEGLRAIMEKDSPLLIHYERKGSEEEWKMNLARLLYEVNLQKFTRYAELKDMLLQTGTDVLGASVPYDALVGIGLSMDRKEATQQEYWTGENLLGRALMEVRRVLREQAAPAAPETAEPAPARRVISRPRRVNRNASAAVASAASAVPSAAVASAAPSAAPFVVPSAAVASASSEVPARRVIRRPTRVAPSTAPEGTL